MELVRSLWLQLILLLISQILMILALRVINQCQLHQMTILHWKMMFLLRIRQITILFRKILQLLIHLLTKEIRLNYLQRQNLQQILLLTRLLRINQTLLLLQIRAHHQMFLQLKTKQLLNMFLQDLLIYLTLQ